MVKRMHRAQILLEPEQHEALAELAEQKGESISAVVRKAVDNLLVQEQDAQALQNRLNALETVRDHKKAILAHHEGMPLEQDPNILIQRGREERVNELIYGAFSDHH